MAEVKVFDMKVFFNPKKSQYRTEVTGNKDMPTQELIDIMSIIAHSLNEKGYKTMGEYFDKQEVPNG